MSKKGHGQIRRSQVITTWGPGALIDLPNDSGIIGGLDTWPPTTELQEISEPRLTQKLSTMTDVTAPRLYSPPPDSSDPREPVRGIGVWRFPQWFIVQEEQSDGQRGRSRRLVHRKALDEKRRFVGRQVVPTRFVRACPRGHVDDIDWRGFVHDPGDTCRRQLWLDEKGTSGDLADLAVRCQCGRPSHSLSEATVLELKPLGSCAGKRPWLGMNTEEPCGLPSRLLIRTAANAYFAQLLSVLSLPDRGTAIEKAVTELWDDLQIVEDAAGLAFLKKKPKIASALAQFDDEEVLKAIDTQKHGPVLERPVKLVELDALLAVPEGFGDDVPIDPDFHARRLPEATWRRESTPVGISSVIQLHRLREVLALAGFTRFEAVTPDINGEYEGDVERAELALEPAWFPAVENRGEGVFLEFRPASMGAWLKGKEVQQRLERLSHGHALWAEDRKVKRGFPGGPFVLLHTVSHLLIHSLSLTCGYPASSIRERIYVDPFNGRFGLLLYTASPDAEGTLGGLVQQARYIHDHLERALRMGILCSNDPVCAQHSPGEDLEDRWLHGAACHGCVLISETSCEFRNDYLDRALVVRTLADPGAAFFSTGI